MGARVRESACEVLADWRLRTAEQDEETPVRPRYLFPAAHRLLAHDQVPAVRGLRAARTVHALYLLQALAALCAESFAQPPRSSYGAEDHRQGLLRCIGNEEVAQAGRGHMHRRAAASTPFTSSTTTEPT